MARQRAEQRLREGRAKPVDVLAANLFLSAEFDPSVTAPYAVFDGLQLNDVRDLADDIRGMQVRARAEPAGSALSALRTSPPRAQRRALCRSCRGA